jgi:hypothetical protein
VSTVPDKTKGGEGFFERDSKIRQVNREMVLLFAGGRALLMHSPIRRSPPASPSTAAFKKIRSPGFIAL